MFLFFLSKVFLNKLGAGIFHSTILETTSFVSSLLYALRRSFFEFVLLLVRGLGSHKLTLRSFGRKMQFFFNESLRKLLRRFLVSFTLLRRHF
jgi:hypothetical protein